jgi:hypothetical protein
MPLPRLRRAATARQEKVQLRIREQSLGDKGCDAEQETKYSTEFSESQGERESVVY